ncbi:MAG: GNAT family N-acetyltransferase [Fimbriimonas sp.]
MRFRNLVIEPVVLEGDIVRLEPAEDRHAADLARFAQPEVFQYFVSIRPEGATEDAVKTYIRNCRSEWTNLTFAIVLKETGEAIGSSSYLDIRRAHLGVEIGMTWIGEPHRGTKINPEMKLLMIGHAFEGMQCERVQLKTDGRNLHSQRAIEKLGAKKEGVLRRHGQMPDGFMRDTVMYSILPDEWPSVKAGLLARLA